jgi:alpha-galactosidase
MTGHEGWIRALAGALLLAGLQAGTSQKPEEAAVTAPDLASFILTPRPPDTPRINGARIFGVRPGHPFLFTIPATGRRPMKFGAASLPAGLAVDAATGRITGKLDEPGQHVVTLTAENELGKAQRELRIVCGERLALTPPLGWNSWNAGGPFVDVPKVRAAATAMVEKGLVQHGWTYVNIDDAWQGKRGGKLGAIQPNEKFPDMKALADEVHALGLKIGIYSTPWVTSYANYVGGSAENPQGTWNGEVDKGRVGRRHGKFPFAWADARQWAEWGFDYLKYDWNPNDVEHVRQMSDALRHSGRDIAYSLSNSAPFEHVDEWAVYANAWRTTGDIRDTWPSMAQKGFGQNKWAPFAGPGHWNDPDMLVVGWVGWQGKLHFTQLTPDEQYTHISLWSLLSAPLLIGCDMAKLDDFTVSLLTNDEVLAVNQDPLGEQAVTVSQVPNPEDPGNEVFEGNRRTEMPKVLEVLAKRMEDGSRAAGLFNRSTKPARVTLRWGDLKLQGKWRVRDLWRQKDLGVFENEFSAEVRPHGVVMVQLFAEAGK